ncbi:MAG TPA: gamma-glutamyltransferase [Gemmatales bacterium]|nr:gamma-glutamyltransferase [Gemmatales bacterium]
MRYLLLVCVIGLLTQASLQSQSSEWPRSPTIAPHGMVATGQPLAAQIGIDILKKGGSAIDAAIAVDAALGLMEPMSCGIGGDLYALVWDNKEKKLYGLNASGRAPYAATLEFFKKKGLDSIPTSGPLSWSVPGCVDGWDVLQKKWGKLPLKDVLTPTIEYAEAGFPVSPVIASYWLSGERLLSRNNASNLAGLKTVFYPNNSRGPRTGEVFKNPQLAKCYRQIGENGRNAYYKGPIAAELLKYSQSVGGLFAQRDFDETAATWVEPVSTTYRGYTVCAIPPPGQGIAALQMLNTLEAYDLKKMGPGSADYWHIFLEAKKLAYADRARFYTDPEFCKVPVKELISKDYASSRRQLIDMNKAMTKVEHGDPKLGQSDTIYLTVVDKDRNCVSFIQSNYNGFGSGLVPPELGFAIQNRGCLFALDETHPNKLEPHKRPFHTIIPGFVLKDGKPWFCFGCMGGDMQPQGQVEVLVNMIDFGMNVQAAGNYPRLEHTGSATPTGKAMASNGGTVQAEPGIPDAVVKELEKRGHVVQRVARNGGGYQGIMIHPVTGMLHGGTEPRKDGMAIGY